MMRTSPLVSTQWLAEHINAPDIRIADASWYLPDKQRDTKAEYQSAHIPRAVFFDIDDLFDETSPLPHMLAPPAKFASTSSIDSRASLQQRSIAESRIRRLGRGRT